MVTFLRVVLILAIVFFIVAVVLNFVSKGRG